MVGYRFFIRIQGHGGPLRSHIRFVPLHLAIRPIFTYERGERISYISGDLRVDCSKANGNSTSRPILFPCNGQMCGGASHILEDSICLWVMAVRKVPAHATNRLACLGNVAPTDRDNMRF